MFITYQTLCLVLVTEQLNKTHIFPCVYETYSIVGQTNIMELAVIITS